MLELKLDIALKSIIVVTGVDVTFAYTQKSSVMGPRDQGTKLSSDWTVCWPTELLPLSIPAFLSRN